MITGIFFKLRRFTPALLVAIFGSFLLSQCSSYDSMDDFRRARAQANNGDGREVVSNIMGDIEDVDPAMHGVAVDTVAVVEGPEARDALFEMLDKPALRAPATRKRIISHLIRRDEPGTVDQLYERFRGDPSFLTGEIIEYFGMRRYTPAIPDIKRSVRNGRYSKEGIRALSMMREGDAEKFVLSLATRRGSPGRTEAIRSLPRLMHPYYKKNARGLIRQLINRPPVAGQKEEYLAALYAAGGLGMQEDFFETLKDVHQKSKDPAIRSQALESMARMKGVDSYLMARDLRLPLAEKQSLLSLWKGEKGVQPLDESERRTYRRRISRNNQDRADRRPSRRSSRASRSSRNRRESSARSQRDRRPTASNNKGRSSNSPGRRANPAALPPRDLMPDIPAPEKRKVADEKEKSEPAPEAKPDASPAEGQAYRSRVIETLASVTPPSVARKLARRIHNAFLSYADFNTPSAKFVFRSYRKAYGGDEARQRVLLRKGLNQPGSLGAVIRNVKTEYGSDEMRIYVIANLFALPRWQASILLEQHEKGTF